MISYFLKYLFFMLCGFTLVQIRLLCLVLLLTGIFSIPEWERYLEAKLVSYVQFSVIMMILFVILMMRYRILNFQYHRFITMLFSMYMLSDIYLNFQLCYQKYLTVEHDKDPLPEICHISLFNGFNGCLLLMFFIFKKNHHIVYISDEQFYYDLPLKWIINYMFWNLLTHGLVNSDYLFAHSIRLLSTMIIIIIYRNRFLWFNSLIIVSMLFMLIGSTSEINYYPTSELSSQFDISRNVLVVCGLFSTIVTTLI